MFALKICVISVISICATEAFFHKGWFLTHFTTRTHISSKYSLVSSKGYVDGFGRCWMPNNLNGLCVPLRECPGLNALANKKHISLADRLFLRRSRCGYIGRSPLVCCPQPDKIVPRLNGGPFQVDDLPNDCGKIHMNRHLYSDYIVGGTESRIFDSPWLALLEYAKCTLKFIGFAKKKTQSFPN